MAPLSLNQELERKSRIFALAGDPTRVHMLRFLADQKEACVSEIAKAVEMSVACVSHHLQLLKDNQVVRAKRSGTTIYYSLLPDTFIKSLIMLIK
jgi:DNA-binding transcriptional ArsR family regulator